MKNQSKLVQSFGIKGEEDFIALLKTKNIKHPWDDILRGVFLNGETYESAGARHRRTKHSVYEYLRAVKDAMDKKYPKLIDDEK